MSSESSPSSKTTLNAALEVYFILQLNYKAFPKPFHESQCPTPSKYAKSSSMGHVVLVLLYYSNRPWTSAYRNIQEILHLYT